ncbi:MAG: enoyl-CoA hydratase-related protein [Candidatus Eremiobacteraeota bacterium]|nr:enoyl-CoA hydratase-related protein [Candidatus Eremiobacteraeota bacterium]
MKTFQTIAVEEVDRMAWITINRPEARNALSSQVLDELAAALKELSHTPEVKVILITGSGDKAFVAGADIRELESLDRQGAIAFSRKGQALMELIESLEKPVIAVVNGYALGGGCELAMACDMRIASEKAQFGQPEITLGLIPGYGGTQRLPRLVGKERAMGLLLTGRIITAQEALKIGLVMVVVPHESLRDEARVLAQKVSEKSGPVAALIKKAVNRGMEVTLGVGCAVERELFGSAFELEDKKEGISAFHEKRSPRFADK